MRVLVYDRTCVGGLSKTWAAGSWLYRGLRRLDVVRGVASWEEAIDWLATMREPIRELQYWGHGRWGRVLIDKDILDARVLTASDPRHGKLRALRERLAPDALVWFRTCETFGARVGIAFAEDLADFLGARVAGHTHVIHFHQSGLHGLAPGQRATWSPDEGIAEGTAEQPKRAHTSSAWAPHTIPCLGGRVPDAWFHS